MAMNVKSAMYFLTSLLIGVTCIQTGAMAQSCETISQCCMYSNQCPSGYFEDSECMVISPSIPTTTIEVTSSDPENVTSDMSSDAVTDYDNTTDLPSTFETSSPNTEVICSKCVDNCMACTSNDTCSTCNAGFKLIDGVCQLPIKNGDFPLGAVVGGVIAGVVVIGAVIICVVFILKRRSGTNTDAMDQQIKSRNDERKRDEESPEMPDTPEQSGSSPIGHRDYENLGFKPDNLSTKIQENQDRVLRYTKDPTFKKTEQQDNRLFDDESEATYANHASIMKHEWENLPEAPPPPAAKGGKKKKKRKSTFKATPEAEPEEEIYVNDGATEGGEEVYYNQPQEDDGETTYVNYTPKS